MTKKIFPACFLILSLLAASCNKDGGVNNSGDSPMDLKAPTNLTFTSATASSISVQWTDNSSFETGFEIQQSTDGNNYSSLKIVNANVTTLTIIDTFYLDTTYSFRVRAIASNNQSLFSNTIRFNSAAEEIIVEGGTFTMGSPSSIGFPEEQPLHNVTLSDFYIGRFEVTQKRWRDVVHWKQANGGTTLPENPSSFSGNNLPVENITWNEIQTWLGYLNEIEGLTNSPNRYRLPTEAEWEYSALGGKHWTDNYSYSGSNIIDEIAWYATNGGGKTHIVGTKRGNQLGINDMNGNVWEWCSDYYSNVYYQICKDSGTVVNPMGPMNGTSRTVRGGSFYDDNDCRVALRSFSNPESHNVYFGFRIARSK